MRRAAVLFGAALIFAAAASFAASASQPLHVPGCKISETDGDLADRQYVECLGPYLADGGAKAHAVRGERFLQLFFDGWWWGWDEIVIQIVATPNGAHYADLFYGGHKRLHRRVPLSDRMFDRIQGDWLVYGSESEAAKGERDGSCCKLGPVCSDLWVDGAASNLGGHLRYFTGNGCQDFWIETVADRIAAELASVLPGCAALKPHHYDDDEDEDPDEIEALPNCVWLKGDTRSAAMAVGLLLDWRVRITPHFPTEKRRELFQGYVADDVTLTIAGGAPIRGADEVFAAWEKLSQPRGTLPQMSLDGDATGFGDHATLKGRVWLEWETKKDVDDEKRFAPFEQLWVKGADGKWRLSRWRIGGFVQEN